MDTRGTTRNAKASALSWIGRPSSERPLQMLRMCSSRRRPLRTSYSIDGLSSCERLRAVVSLPSTSSLIGNFMVEGGADITAAAAAAGRITKRALGVPLQLRSSLFVGGGWAHVWNCINALECLREVEALRRRTSTWLVWVGVCVCVLHHAS